VKLSPAFSKHARVLCATWNGKRVELKVNDSANDQHASIDLPFADGEAVIRAENDFGLEADEDLPPLGAQSRNLKIFHEQWSADRKQLTVRVAVFGADVYRLHAFGARIASVDGAALKADKSGAQFIEISAPPGLSAGYSEQQFVLHF
jgi:hypothetical protein